MVALVGFRIFVISLYLFAFFFTFHGCSPVRFIAIIDLFTTCPFIIYIIVIIANVVIYSKPNTSLFLVFQHKRTTNK